MINPRREAILVRDKRSRKFEDQTYKISRYQHHPDGKITIQFDDGRQYRFGQSRVRVLRDPQQCRITEDTRVLVHGTRWDNVFEVRTFPGPEGRWTRVFYRKQTGEGYRTYPEPQVQILDIALPAGMADDVRSYWNAVVADLSEQDDPIVRAYKNVEFHTGSALHTYVTGAPVRSTELSAAPIYPFRCNLSQRQAVENALTHNLSVIEGPPGTGKTETILNLIANVVVRGQTVGVVAQSNSAVNNVREKLDELGFGHVVANLGNKEKQQAFFAGQHDRNERVDEFVAEAPPDPADLDRLAALDRTLRELQRSERLRAERRQEVEAYRLEQQHFEQHLQAHRDEIPELADLPLLRHSSERVLDYLAESELERNGARPGLLRRIVKYFRYGSRRGLNPDDTNVVLRLQQAYYDKRIAELDAEIAGLDDELQRADFEEVAREHQQLSIQVLHTELAARYRGLDRTTYAKKSYKKKPNFSSFIRDYPVLLSTCHSLRNSLPPGHLLDYLVVDEASQVDPIVAALALACCQNLVVVGDTQQLRPIPPRSAKDHAPPSPAYDCRLSILSSLAQIHGDDLPRTLLREHYRCDPTIIGFCNKKFYGGKLIPFTSGAEERPMVVARTVEGNHMRRHPEGSRWNQREIDVIQTEVLPEHCKGIPDEDIGITTPYALQVRTADDVLDNIQVATVHKFQGRQKKVVVLTTVLDETAQGRAGQRFVDDPKLINVAVSRAIERFVLVTNNDMMPGSRHVRDLVGHIDYHAPGEGIVDSAVVSVFDLLYTKFSERLESLNRRLHKHLPYRSENIASTVLHDVLGEQQYAHLAVVSQVLLKSLMPDYSRLTRAQATYVGNAASVDFLVYNRVSNRPLLAIEVDGAAFHANNPKQLRKDRLKDEIFQAHDMPLLRLPTTGSGEQQRIREALDEAEARSARVRFR